MVKCIDCRHFYWDVDDYPVCGVHQVMVNGPWNDEPISACAKLDGKDLFKPKE